jgi:hypothetical protein
MNSYVGVDAWLHASLTLALDGGEWSALSFGRLTPEERAPSTHWIGSSGGGVHSLSGRGGKEEKSLICR